MAQSGEVKSKLRMTTRLQEGFVRGNIFPVVILMVFAALGAQGGTIFFDGFESYSAPSEGDATVSSGGSFGSWNVAAGSIDILNTYPGLPCHVLAQCLDMDGSTEAAGTIQRSFTATVGVTYTLDFWVAGNNRGGSDSMDVYVGVSVLHLTGVLSTYPWTERSLTFTASSTGFQLVQFQHFGADNVGLLLDDVTLTDNARGAVPEPGTWSLMAGGLLAAGLLRRRKA